MTALATGVMMALLAQFVPLQESFDGGTVGSQWKINLGSKGSYARYEPRNGGKCLHLFGDHAGAVLVTRSPVADLAYTLEYDFYQPAKETGGYQAVVQHSRPEGHAYWWLEYGPGRFFLYTVAGGQWYNRWQGGGLPADRWYHIVVRNTPTSVQVRVYDEAGEKLLRQSEAIPHDTGSPGALVFSATGTEKGVWGMKLDQIALDVTPVAERDDYRHRQATVQAAEQAAAAEGVRKLWPQAREALRPVKEALDAVGKVDAADWAAYVKASEKLDETLRSYAEQYHAKVVAKLPQRQGHWVMVDLWQHFNAETSLLGIAAPAAAPLATVQDVPFAAMPFGRNCLWQDEGSRSQRALALGTAARRIALLLAPRYNGALYNHDDSLVDVLQVELRYADGRRERVVPVPMGWQPQGPAGVGRPPYQNGKAGVYIVVPGHAAQLKQLVLSDGATQAGWAVLGLSYEPGLPAEVPVMRASAKTLQMAKPSAEKASAAVAWGRLTLATAALRLEMSTRKGLIVRLSSPLFGEAIGPDRPSPYFAVQVGDRVVYSDSFQVTGVEPETRAGSVSATVTLRGPDELKGLEARVSISLDKRGTGRWRAQVRNRGDKPLRLRLVFPLLDGLTLGKAPGWFFPQRGGAASNLPFEGLSSYGGMAWLQVVDAWRSSAGGVYLRSDDTTGLYKVLALRSVPMEDARPRRQADLPKPAHPLDPWRAKTGVHLSLQYWPRELAPGESWEPPAATVGAHA
ncbi:MAG: hypothetical protein J7M26_06725, partial [Armatimonadetes bacterium]|nr:hypothetical protein [Armatimonadota bacterium]